MPTNRSKSPVSLDAEVVDDEPSAVPNCCTKASASRLVTFWSPLLSAAPRMSPSRAFRSPAARSAAETTPSPLVSSGSVAVLLDVDDELSVAAESLGGGPGGGPCGAADCCAKSIVDAGFGTRLFMPASSSSLLMLPSPSVSSLLNSASALCAVAPVFFAMSSSMPCSSLLSTLPFAVRVDFAEQPILHLRSRAAHVGPGAAGATDPADSTHKTSFRFESSHGADRHRWRPDSFGAACRPCFRVDTEGRALRSISGEKTAQFCVAESGSAR